MSPPSVPVLPPPVIADDDMSRLLVACQGKRFEDRRDRASHGGAAAELRWGGAMTAESPEEWYRASATADGRHDDRAAKVLGTEDLMRRTRRRRPPTSAPRGSCRRSPRLGRPAVGASTTGRDHLRFPER